MSPHSKRWAWGHAQSPGDFTYCALLSLTFCSIEMKASSHTKTSKGQRTAYAYASGLPVQIIYLFKDQLMQFFCSSLGIFFPKRESFKKLHKSVFAKFYTLLQHPTLNQTQATCQCLVSKFQTLRPHGVLLGTNPGKPNTSGTVRVVVTQPQRGCSGILGISHMFQLSNYVII